MTKNITLVVTIMTSLLFDSYCQISGESFLFEGGNYEIQILSNGQLIGDADEGVFHLKDSDTQMARSAGLWVMGITPASLISGAVHCNINDDLSDFQSGSIGGFGVHQFWEVTKEDILDHLDDYFDNLIIDHPIPVIYAWPGKENPFFELYTGFPLPEDLGAYAPFFDRNGDGVYDPAAGDFPTENMTTCDFQIADRLVWLIFNDQKEHSISGTVDPKGLEISLTLSSFECENDQALNNSLYLNYDISNLAVSFIDSTFIGFYLDGDIGCPDDDYVGSIPDLGSMYFYNANDEDLSCPPYSAAGSFPPILSATLIQGPITQFGNILGLTKTMPLYKYNATYPATQLPEVLNSNQFYNYLTGSWKDGTPLTFGGDGYQNSIILTDFAFPDLPNITDGWSELTANNPLGDRAIIGNTGSVRIESGESVTLKYALSIFDTPDNSSVDEQFSFLTERLELVRIINNGCDIPNTFDFVDCSITNTTAPINPVEIDIYPNPSNGQLYIINNNNQSVAYYKVFTINGQKVKSGAIIDQQIQLSGLSNGMYLLQLGNKNGILINQKIIIQQ